MSFFKNRRLQQIIKRNRGALTLLSLGALALSSPVFANSQSDEATSEKNTFFQSEDIFNLEYVSEVQVSPNGKYIAYVRRSNDIMSDSSRANVWLASVDGKSHRPLLSSKKNYYSIRWSPDGSRLAYLSNEEGKPQLYVRWMDTGQTALVTNVTSSPSNITWSPDGKYIAFTMSVDAKEKPLDVKMPKKPEGAKWSPKFQYITKARYQADGKGVLDPAYTHIFIVPSDGGTARQLTSGNYHHNGRLSFAPNGEKIYFSANRSDNWEYEPVEADIFSVDMTGNIEQLTQDKGRESSPVVSPDGKYIAYAYRDDEKVMYKNSYLYVMNSDGSEQRNITKDIDNSVSNFHWKDNKRIYFQQSVRGLAQVDVVSLSGSVKAVAKGLGGTTLGRPYVFGTYHAVGDVVAYTKGRTDRPADLFVTTRKERQLTALNEDVLGHKQLGEVKEVVYPSSIDGEEIQGWYILPPNYDSSKTYPLILEIHGGPNLAYGPVFTAELQRMAAEGYVVFYDNHRGSTGYGERFALLLQGKYSSEYDFADHMSGVDALIEKGIADPERLFITGGSAGGIASAYAIGLTNRFKAAVVAKPVINWLSKVLSADSGLYQIPFQFPGKPWDNVEHYWKRSPLSLVGNVTTPTMLITGVEDKRTPMSETEQFYQALKLQKVDSVLVKVPGSPHGIAAKPSRMIGKIENILAWFKKYDSDAVKE
ncbi:MULTISPECIES: alpha/beta hydrolase family protein [Alteromonas]|jgi:dipeptidyl aminopeptidase/acylaminoacyl peptidase|uniref:Acyl-peptide hydrolase n=1 Tax=Alteromonas mediterranea TaxID=314275 RepID=A0AAC8XHR7_9ALTE|nr:MULTISPECIES: S9 family peptidase [Alteromonas]AGP92608.1 acylaminoacyl-peptidase [Alteromonas mediterranea U8]MBR9783669.1 S9 family peptidase [Gammaproteobacteria bacterium]AFV84347.1 acylaminoacyl-peptidase [Alteromonas mediterranea DE1]AGP84610.1 acylaminoacyl-peptidase [Alteromonas mediterranea U4]AGP88726.1 acylaminoacyl-peptidase [Alteromonas mediterranea U7]|tara:strand:- start:655 stop:2763 length:2109 start_codon:yes stop_codon:yes gene_type:complete